jgi:hypothetical protein
MTTAERVIQFLGTQTEPVNSEQLAAQLGVQVSNLTQSTRVVRDTRQVLAHRMPGRGMTLWWSLPTEAEPAEPAEPTEPEEFNASLHLDGDLDLYGLVELEDGGWRITRENLVRLKKLITWTAP